MEAMPRFSTPTGLSGTLLVAHPTLNDPHFSQTVILIPVHTEENGALGVVLNRPTGRTLGEIYPEQKFHKLAQIEVYEGGPVDSKQLILTAWKWDATESSHKMFFGITSEHAMELIESEEAVLIRGYLGYAGWSAGQLESEMQSNSWLQKPLHPDFFNKESSERLWEELVESTLSEEDEDAPGDWFTPPENPEWN